MKLSSLPTGLLAAVLLTATAQAQVFDLSWNSIDSGGTMFSSAGAFTLTGTIGQPDAGELSGGPFRLVGGFWDSVCLGDLDGDRIVRLQDLTLFLSAFGACAGDSDFNLAADLNGNGCVSLSDLTIFLSHFGVFCN